jgi:hypothetical protein
MDATFGMVAIMVFDTQVFKIITVGHFSSIVACTVVVYNLLLALLVVYGDAVIRRRKPQLQHLSQPVLEPSSSTAQHHQ